jgi:hypothetical protein
MITPKPFPTLWARVADFWRRMTLSPAAFEEQRVSEIYGEMGGVISREEIRRIVRAHRI